MLNGMRRTAQFDLIHDDDGKCTAAFSLFQTRSQFLNALQLQVDKQKSTDREMSTELLADRLVLRLLEILCPKGSVTDDPSCLRTANTTRSK